MTTRTIRMTMNAIERRFEVNRNWCWRGPWSMRPILCALARDALVQRLQTDGAIEERNLDAAILHLRFPDDRSLRSYLSDLRRGAERDESIAVLESLSGASEWREQRWRMAVLPHHRRGVCVRIKMVFDGPTLGRRMVRPI